MEAVQQETGFQVDSSQSAGDRIDSLRSLVKCISDRCGDAVCIGLLVPDDIYSVVLCHMFSFCRLTRLYFCQMLCNARFLMSDAPQRLLF
jgi:hypothetical protein